MRQRHSLASGNVAASQPLYCSISTRMKRGRNGVEGLLVSEEPFYCYVNGFCNGWFVLQQTCTHFFSELSAPAPQPTPPTPC